MAGRLTRRIAVALVALSALAALVASSGIAAPRQPGVTLRPLESGLLAHVNARRVQHHIGARAAHVAPKGIAAPRQQAIALSPLESGVLANVNALRAQHHLAALRLSAPLYAAARAHTREMAADGYFEHESANGTSFSKRIQTFYPWGRWSTWSAGENLLWASPDIDPQDALQTWLDSPPHRANLLNPSWREIGIAAVHATAAPGEYGGQDVTIVTADFGVRR